MKGFDTMATTGVLPVFKNEFKISTSGRGDSPTMAVVKEMETFSVSMDGNVEEWTPMDTELGPQADDWKNVYHFIIGEEKYR